MALAYFSLHSLMTEATLPGGVEISYAFPMILFYIVYYIVLEPVAGVSCCILVN